MSNSVFQSVIVQLKDVSDRTFGVLDTDGYVISCTDVSLLGERWPDAVLKTTGSGETMLIYDNKTFRNIFGSMGNVEYVVFCAGDDEQARLCCNMAYVSFYDAKMFYEERYDRNTFIKNIITDNILPGDVYLRARDLHFTDEEFRAVFLIRQVGHTDIAAVDTISRLFPDRVHDFIINLNETDIAVIKRLDKYATAQELDRIAVSIEDALKNELHIKSIIGIGTVTEQLRDLADAFKEAQTAIEVGRVFNEERSINHYESLGIGRLIYQLPTTLCDIYLTEVFKKNPIDSLDQETLFTINKFFENNLNVSETSRRLFVHRNTLVYRLEKIKKLTGLDLRQFDHAIIFKVALMVRGYLSSRDLH